MCVAVAELSLGYCALLLAVQSAQKTGDNATLWAISALSAPLGEQTGAFCNSHRGLQYVKLFTSRLNLQSKLVYKKCGQRLHYLRNSSTQ
jgi:hypothetical protein